MTLPLVPRAIIPSSLARPPSPPHLLGVSLPTLTTRQRFVAEPAAKTDLPPGFKPGNTPEFSVSELVNAIKRALEDGFGHVRLRGEVSGYQSDPIE